jgi:hypothetical protein
VFRARLHNLIIGLVAAPARRLHRLPSAYRQALALTLISALGWSTWNWARAFTHPWGDLGHGRYSDHFSHMNAARVFPRIGLDLWRVPIANKFRLLTAEQLDHEPPDIRLGASDTGGVYDVPGWPEGKPLAMSWSNKTRMYPPGDMLLVAPIAALYHYTNLSFGGACHLLIGWFIVLAHPALFFFFLMLFEGKSRVIDWLGCFFAYVLIMYWTLQGFYDAAAITPLILCARYLGQGRGLAAGVAYCAAAIVHFRVFFQAPWAMVAAGMMVRDRFWQRLHRRQVVAIGVAATLACISLYVFWLDWASLGKVEINNPLRPDGGEYNAHMTWICAIILGVCGLAFLISRSWLDLVSLAWLGLVLFRLREFYLWHLLISVAWIAAPFRSPAARVVRIGFLVAVLILCIGFDL